MVENVGCPSDSSLILLARYHYFVLLLLSSKSDSVNMNELILFGFLHQKLVTFLKAAIKVWEVSLVGQCCCKTTHLCESSQNHNTEWSCSNLIHSTSVLFYQAIHICHSVVSLSTLCNTSTYSTHPYLGQRLLVTGNRYGLSSCSMH